MARGELGNRWQVEWLLRAADDPGDAVYEWRERGKTLLRCGRTFAAVRIPADLVHAALGTTDPVQIAALLPDALCGPVIWGGPETSIYALIQAHAGLVWDGGDDTPCLGQDENMETFLGVPALERISPPGDHWVVPPRNDEQLCRPERVRAFIARARANLAAVES